jgi:3-hydroxyacyl-[acyl-carrier-protein] dehydratase
MPSMNIDEIIQALPQGHPFIFVDRVIDYKEDKSYIHAIKNIAYNEQYFLGHFPVTPVMPGALIIESMAQALGAVCLHIDKPSSNKELFVLAGVDAARFKQMVKPGDQMHLKCYLIKARKSIVKYHCEAWVDEKLCCEADLILVREIQA